LKKIIFEREEMKSWKNNGSESDPLTDWALAAIDLLKSIHETGMIDEMAYRDRMLVLVEALDQGKADSFFDSMTFRKKTENLLLAMLRGERIDVADPHIFNARNEIFAAAQVIYNQGVVRGFWELHPEIQQAMGHDQ
jgi:hypothetical protein